MSVIAKPLTDAEIDDLAAWYGIDPDFGHKPMSKR